MAARGDGVFVAAGILPLSALLLSPLALLDALAEEVGLLLGLELKRKCASGTVQCGNKIKFKYYHFSMHYYMGNE